MPNEALERSLEGGQSYDTMWKSGQANGLWWSYAVRRLIRLTFKIVSKRNSVGHELLSKNKVTGGGGEGEREREREETVHRIKPFETLYGNTIPAILTETSPLLLALVNEVSSSCRITQQNDCRVLNWQGYGWRLLWSTWKCPDIHLGETH
jgi:hypothetical protein